MPLTRLELTNHVKSSRGLTRNREDGLLPDTLIHEAINEAILQVGIDCGLLPVAYRFALKADQWKYPMPQDMFELRSLYYVDSSGNYLPMTILSREIFLDGRNPETDSSLEPSFAAYPIYYQRVIQPFGLARPLHDFVQNSHVTTEHARTVEDTGINFGRTLDGTRISPGGMVKNRTTEAFGYIEFLDTITDKAPSVTAVAGTNSTTVVRVGNWPSTIKADDIICTPGTGNVTTYAFVVSISTTSLTYEAIRGDASSFSSGDIVKVGTAQKIRLSLAAPHRGLRDGSSAVFNKGSTTATMTTTTFTNTRCTGTSPSGAAVGEIAIASGGSHGKITAVESAYIDVVEWIGGLPSAGETVTIQECDEYEVLTTPNIEPVIYLGPTPTTSDDAGTRSMVADYVKRPFFPEHDWQYVDIPDKYRTVLYRCVEWQAQILAGTLPPATVKKQYQDVYDIEATKFAGDIDRGPKGDVMTVGGNRSPRVIERQHTTHSGVPYNVGNLLG